jgi:hypothetical protein
MAFGSRDGRVEVVVVEDARNARDPSYVHVHDHDHDHDGWPWLSSIASPARALSVPDCHSQAPWGKRSWQPQVWSDLQHWMK